VPGDVALASGTGGEHTAAEQAARQAKVPGGYQPFRADPPIVGGTEHADHDHLMNEPLPPSLPLEAQNGPQRAYVLEDDPAIAALEADVLRELGFGVVVCSRIVELGDLMEIALPHLMVVDVMLPDGDGGDITELLRTAWPGIPVIVVSAASRDRLAELSNLGPIVTKPFDIDTFTRAALEAMATPRELRNAS
jgi:CheY-like chemotaxis protein